MAKYAKFDFGWDFRPQSGSLQLYLTGVL